MEIEQTNILADFFGHDRETLQRVRSEGRGDGDIGRITPAGNEDSSDARHVVPRIKSIPAATEVHFHPGGKIHGARGGRNADVAKITGAVACWNIHTAAESNSEVGIVAADSCALVECFKGRFREARILIPESDVVMDVIADRLHTSPSGRRFCE